MHILNQGIQNGPGSANAPAWWLVTRKSHHPGSPGPLYIPWAAGPCWPAHMHIHSRPHGRAMHPTMVMSVVRHRWSHHTQCATTARWLHHILLLNCNTMLVMYAVSTGDWLPSGCNAHDDHRSRAWHNIHAIAWACSNTYPGAFYLDQSRDRGHG